MPCVRPPAGASANGNGYFRVKQAGRRRYAHRVAYEVVHGPISAGLVIDHLCRNRWCCNPDHLEPVTNSTNILRGTGASARNAAKTHCPAGHEYYVRLDGKRRCSTCDRDRAIARGEQQGRDYTGKRTHCPAGHPYDEKNTGVGRQGGGQWIARHCRTCNRERNRVYRLRKRMERQQQV